jgi:pSer/pThr/pTyr-binding forkhead associated (FHA) protein
MLEMTIISESGQAVRKLELPRGTSIRIGRARECDIRVAAPTVSRHHAEVIDDGDGWIFRDTDSTHGSLVNGQKVREIEITAGLEIRIGPALLRFDNLASRIGRELDELLDEDEARGGPISVEIIGRDGRHTATLDETLAHWTPGTPPAGPPASQPSPVQARKLRRPAVDKR